jgi:2-polyprenyl-6-methoxyphenol hydroxylase-like FAD-dependent oxidoreductase
MVDVAIVGAGPVGLLLACLLADQGVDVAVLERRATPSRETRAIGIHPPGLAALDAAGVGASVRREATPIRRGIASCRGRILGSLDFHEAPILSLPQDVTERILQARLAQLAPGALRRGVHVSALRELPAHVVLETEGGDQTWAARYVVGADGVRSTVRAALGVASVSRRGTACYAMADAREKPGPPATALLQLEPDGVLESFPLPGGMRRWVARLDHAGTLDAAAFTALIESRARERIALSSAPSGFTARQRLATSFARGRIALVGDAAHEVSPIGGQGMNLGWLDAVHLARAVSDALAAGAPSAAFTLYDRTRRAAASRAMRRAAFNMAMGAPGNGAWLTARNAFVRALTRRPARGLLLRAFTMHGL